MLAVRRARRVQGIAAPSAPSPPFLTGVSLGGGITAATISAGGFPNVTTTGVPSGTTLTASGSVASSANGQVIDALDISGTVTITHTGVLVKRCRIRLSNETNIVKPNATGCVIQDCEIDGLQSGSTGIRVANSVQYVRCYIHGCENAGSVAVNAGSLTDCFIYDLSPEAGTGFHTDGLEFDTNASFLTLEHCNIEPVPEHVRDSTSCININNEVGASNNNITINNCRIDGRGTNVAVYFPRFSGWSQIHFTNNRMRAGDTGYSDTGSNTTTWSGNVDDLTGATVGPND